MHERDAVRVITPKGAERLEFGKRVLQLRLSSFGGYFDMRGHQALD